MAKQRKTDEENVEMLDTGNNTVKVNWQEVALNNEQKAYEALERATKLEDLLAKIMPDLHLAARYMNSLQLEAGRRFEKTFFEARTLLGVRGEEIDKQMRT